VRFRKFFPSIDHPLLKELFRRLLKDRSLLALMDQIVDASTSRNGCVLVRQRRPVRAPGSPARLADWQLTSQWFANCI